MGIPIRIPIKNPIRNPGVALLGLFWRIPIKGFPKQFSFRDPREEIFLCEKTSDHGFCGKSFRELRKDNSSGNDFPTMNSLAIPLGFYMEFLLLRRLIFWQRILWQIF